MYEHILYAVLLHTPVATTYHMYSFLNTYYTLGEKLFKHTMHLLFFHTTYMNIFVKESAKHFEQILAEIGN